MAKAKRKPHGQRRLRRIALGGGIVGSILAVWLFFFSLPVGWAVNWCAPLFLPGDNIFEVKVESATLRWRRGEERLHLTARNVRVTVQSRPLLLAAGAVIELDKAAFRRGQYEPRLVELTGPKLIVDFTREGALSVLDNHEVAPSSPASKPLLADLAETLPTIGATSQMRIEGLLVELVFPGQRWSLPPALIEADLKQTDRRATFEVSADFGTIERPARLMARAEVWFESNRLHFDLTLPRLRIADLPSPPGGTLPLDATIELTAEGGWELSSGRLTRGQTRFRASEGALTLAGVPGAPIALEEIELQLRAEQRTRDAGNELGLQLERGIISIEGARLEIKSLTAGIAEEEAQVAWEMELADLAGSKLRPRMPARLADQLPWLDAILEPTSLTRATSRGEASFQRQAQTWIVGKSASTTDLALHVGSAVVPISVTTQQELPDVIDLRLKTGPFAPRVFAHGVLVDSFLGACALPLQLEARACLTPSGEFLEGGAHVEISAGEFLPWGRARRAIAIQSLVLDTEILEKGTRLRVPTLDVVTSLGRLSARQLEVVVEGKEAVTATGDVSVTEVSGGAVANVFSDSLFAPLHQFGVKPADLVLARLDGTMMVRAEARVANQPGDGVSGQVKTTAQLRLMDRPIDLRVEATLPKGGTELAGAFEMAEFRPADFQSVIVADRSLADFRFPLQVSGRWTGSAESGALKSAEARLRAGAGELRAEELGGLVPFREAAVDARWDVDARRLRLPTAQLQLTEHLQFSLENASVTVAPSLSVEGTMKFSPFAVESALTWWPDTLLPSFRRMASDVVRSGEIRTEGIAFAVAKASAETDLELKTVRGEIEMRGLKLTPADVPGPVEVAEMKLLADYPRATLQVRSAQAPALTIVNATVRTADVRALGRQAEFDAHILSDLSGLRRWKTVTSDAIAQSTGTLRGAVKGKVSLEPNALTGTQMVATLSGDDIVLPEVYHGVIAAEIETTATDARTVAIGAKLDLSRGKWPGGAATPPQPIRVQATLRDWAGGETPSMELGVEAAEFLGGPLRIKAAAEFADHGTRLTMGRIDDLRVGRTAFRADWRQLPGGSEKLQLRGERIDVAQLLTLIMPWLDTSTALDSAPDVIAIQTSGSPFADAGSTSAVLPRNRQIDVQLAEIDFGHARMLRGVQAQSNVKDGWPRSLTLRAHEDERRRVYVELGELDDRQRLTVVVDDVASLLQTVTEPWRAMRLTARDLVMPIKSISQVPLLVAGGKFELEGDIRAMPLGRRGSGRFSLTNATMIQAPRVLQLLAIKSGKRLEHAPLIRELSVGAWAVDHEAIGIKEVELQGSGLIDRLKFNSARYELAGEKLAIDGAYFGIGFEIVGTRATPQVFLKDNVLIRAIGRQNEFDFFDDDASAASKGGNSETRKP